MCIINKNLILNVCWANWIVFHADYNVQFNSGQVGLQVIRYHAIIFKGLKSKSGIVIMDQGANSVMT